MIRRGVNMMKTMIIVKKIALKVPRHRSDLIRMVLPMKNAMKIDSRTPVDRVKVLIPKKKHPRRTAEL